MIQLHAIIHEWSLAIGDQHHSQTKCLVCALCTNTSKLPLFLMFFSPVTPIGWELVGIHKPPSHINFPQWLWGPYWGSLIFSLSHLNLSPGLVFVICEGTLFTFTTLLGMSFLLMPPTCANVPLPSLGLLVLALFFSNPCRMVEPPQCPQQL